jgi:hypothetical protein
VSSKQSKFFFVSNQNKPKLNLFWLFFGLFRETKKHFFQFVSVCFGVSDRYRNNRNKQNFLETNRKNLQKTFSIRGSSKQFFFFLSVRTETQSVSVVFRFAFLRNQQNFFRFVAVCFDVSDRYHNNRNKQNLWYGELKRLIFFQICCCFGWSFVCFGCFETPKLPVSILKRNNRNKHLVSDSAKTSFGSSFGCFDTKLVSEDTLV